MLNKLREYILALLGAFFLFAIVVFWSVVSSFFQSNPWYINIAIFVGIGFFAERIERWRTRSRLRNEVNRSVGK